MTTCSYPLVTLTITTYNHERYIAEAVLGALAQIYSPLEIIISDDCSIDNTFEIAQNLVKNYRGPHKIILNRNEKNIGLIAHVNKVLALARGELILGSSGDDISLPNRAQRMVYIYLRSGRRPILIHGDVQCINMHGQQLGVKRPPSIRRHMTLLDIALAEGIYIGASSAFSRSLLEQFEAIREHNVWEDLVWGFRAALLDGLMYYQDPVVLYRIDTGITAKMAYQNSLPEMLVANRKRREIQLNVLMQRLSDTQKVEADSIVQQALVRRIAVEGIRLALMSDPIAAFSENALKQPLKLLSALALEANAWAQSLVRNLLVLVRSTRS